MMLKASRRGAHGIDLGAADAPLTLDLVQGLLAALDYSAVVFDVQAAVFADVPKVRGDRPCRGRLR